MAEGTSNPYDEVPYHDFTFQECHPDRLAVLAVLHGLTPPPIERARVLELGCASGGNIIPLAYALPDAHFLGIDLSPRQVAAGRSTIRELGLSNIELRALSIAEVGQEFQRFDYILCHGVYSWVPPAIREAILTICTTHLQPDGLAYVSYNTLPGWYYSGIVRDLMLYHAGTGGDSQRRLHAAREALGVFLNSGTVIEGLYGQMLRAELDRARKSTDTYLLHEHLEAENHAFYFHEFLSQIEAKGLRYVGDARATQAPQHQPPEALAILDRLGGDDELRREQYLDFLRNRNFRRSILARGEQPPKPQMVADGVLTLRVLPAMAPTAPVGDLNTDDPLEFRGLGGQMRLRATHPLLKATLILLNEQAPRSVLASDLHEQVLARLAGPRPAGAAPLDRLPGTYGQMLVNWYGASLIDLTTLEPRFAAAAGERPRASRLVRHQAESGNRVVNLRHRPIGLTEFERLVLRQLDGQRDHREIVDGLVGAVVEGRFPLSQNNLPIRDPAAARPILDRSLQPCLSKLARAALLEA